MCFILFSFAGFNLQLNCSRKRLRTRIAEVFC